MVSVESRVKKVINEQLGIEILDIHPEDSITDDFGADSLDLVDLWNALENEFEIEAPIADVWLDKTKTFEDLVAYVEYLLKYESVVE